MLNEIVARAVGVTDTLDPALRVIGEGVEKQNGVMESEKDIHAEREI